jgi:hypothetical protein
MGATQFPTELTAAWQHTLELWAEPTRHDVLLGLTAKHQQFAWLAARYRDASRSNPSDPVAAHRLIRVQRAAAIVMMSKVEPVETPMPRMFKMASMMLLGALIATGLGLVVTEQKVQQHQQNTIQQHHQQNTVISRHP